MTIRMASVLCVISATAGCAAPQYEKPVGTFATATSDVETALAGFARTAADVREDQTRNTALAAPYRVRSLAGDCGPSSTRCRLVVYQPQGDPAPLYQGNGGSEEPPPPMMSAVPPGLVKFMSGISAYAEDLKAIATSKAVENVDANVREAQESVASLAALVPGAGASQGAGYSRSAFTTLDWAKHRGLKAVVAQAEPVLAQAAEQYKGVMEQVGNEMREHLAKAVAARRAAFRKRSTRENLDKVAAAAEAYDAFLMKDTSLDIVFQEMVRAHGSLNEALQSPDASDETLMERMNTFQAHARKLAKTLSDLQGDLRKAQTI